MGILRLEQVILKMEPMVNNTPEQIFSSYFGSFDINFYNSSASFLKNSLNIFCSNITVNLSEVNTALFDAPTVVVVVPIFFYGVIGYL